jgi:hypothetical protein
MTRSRELRRLWLAPASPSRVLAGTGGSQVRVLAGTGGSQVRALAGTGGSQVRALAGTARWPEPRAPESRALVEVTR